MLTIIIRTVLIYIIVTFAVRLMGKRQVGDMQTSELVITMIISEVASLPLENPERPLLSGIVPIIMLVAIEIIVSMIMLKSRRARSLIVGHPIIIIRDGKILDEELQRLRLSREDVFSLLRQQQYPDTQGIKFGVIEPNGSLSVIMEGENVQDGFDSADFKDELEELDDPDTQQLSAPVSETDTNNGEKEPMKQESQLQKDKTGSQDKNEKRSQEHQKDGKKQNKHRKNSGSKNPA